MNRRVKGGSLGGWQRRGWESKAGLGGIGKGKKGRAKKKGFRNRWGASEGRLFWQQEPKGKLKKVGEAKKRKRVLERRWKGRG